MLWSVLIGLAVFAFVAFVLVCLFGVGLMLITKRKPSAQPMFASSPAPVYDPRTVSYFERDEVKSLAMEDFDAKWDQKRTKAMVAKFKETMGDE